MKSKNMAKISFLGIALGAAIAIVTLQDAKAEATCTYTEPNGQGGPGAVVTCYPGSVAVSCYGGTSTNCGVLGGNWKPAVAGGAAAHCNFPITNSPC